MARCPLGPVCDAGGGAGAEGKGACMRQGMGKTVGAERVGSCGASPVRPRCVDDVCLNALRRFRSADGFL